MIDRVQVTIGLRDIDCFLAERMPYEEIKGFLRTIDYAIVLLKEQEKRIKTLESLRRIEQEGR